MGGPRGDEESTAMDIDGASDDAAAAAAIPLPTWTPGAQVPPFVATNGPAVQLCEAIMADTATDLPELVVSEALAVQIYRLVMNPAAQGGAAPLHSFGWAGVYRILASLARRQLVGSITITGDLDRLRHALARKRSDSKPPGLDGALRLAASQRKGDPELKGLSFVEVGACSNWPHVTHERLRSSREEHPSQIGGADERACRSWLCYLLLR